MISENTSWSIGSSITTSKGLFGIAVPLNFIISPISNFSSTGDSKITLSVFTSYVLVRDSLPSDIFAVYFPSGASNETMIGSFNFQFPFASTSADFVVISWPEGLMIVPVTVLFG